MNCSHDDCDNEFGRSEAVIGSKAIGGMEKYYCSMDCLLLDQERVINGP